MSSSCCTCWCVSGVEYSRQTEVPRVVGLHIELGDVDDGDGSVLTRRQTPDTQSEHIRTLCALFQQKRLLTRTHSVIILIPRLQDTVILHGAKNMQINVQQTYIWTHGFSVLHLCHNLLLSDLGTEVADSSISGQREHEQGLQGALFLMHIQQSGGDCGDMILNTNLH